MPVTRILHEYGQFFRFLVAGGTAYLVNLMVLYFFTDLLNVYYLFSTVIAFVISFVVSFSLQKMWTFKVHSYEFLHIELPLYLGMQLINLAIDTALLYLFVQYMHVWYLLAQAIILAILAIFSFIINRRFIFRERGSMDPAGGVGVSELV